MELLRFFFFFSRIFGDVFGVGKRFIFGEGFFWVGGFRDWNGVYALEFRILVLWGKDGGFFVFISKD